MGRFVHIPPSDPSDDFASDFDLPWWKVKTAIAKEDLEEVSHQTLVVRTTNRMIPNYGSECCLKRRDEFES